MSSKSEIHNGHKTAAEAARMEKVLKNTFAALDQLTDLFTEIRKG